LKGGEIVGQFTQGGILPLTFARSQASQAKIEPLTQAALAKLRADAGAPAMAAAAIKRGGRRVAFVDGVRAIGRPEVVTPGDMWHVGSCTESMTATLVARAAEAGLVRWDDTVGAALGSAVPQMRSEYRDVTYRHLLSHRSGMAGNIEIAELIKFPRERDDARQDRIAYSKMALAAAPRGPKERQAAEACERRLRRAGQAGRLRSTSRPCARDVGRA
jgi:CubicO group peptidase (beta-lactamase class C family)